MPPRKPKTRHNSNGLGSTGVIDKGPRKGKYFAAITMGKKPDGKLDRRVRYFPTAPAADAWLTEMKMKRAETTGLAPTIPGDLNITEYITLWLDEIVIPNRAPKTIELYSGIARNHILPDLGPIKLDRLDALTIDRLLRRKRDQGVGKRTVQLIHIVLHNALNQAHRKWRLIKENPVDSVDRPKIDRRKQIFLNQFQARAFLKAIENDPFEAAYVLAIAEALRIGEVLALKWDVVRLDAAEIDVEATLQRIDGKLANKSTKTEGSTATMPIGQITVQALRDYGIKQDLLRTRAGARWQETGYVFTTPIGTPVDHRNFYRHYKEILSTHKLPDIRFHDLRVTCASLMVVNNENPRVVMQKLRHKQISTTMNIYAQVESDLQREASNRLDALLGGPRPTDNTTDNTVDETNKSKRVKRRLPARKSRRKRA